MSKKSIWSIKFIVICALLLSSTVACSAPAKEVDLPFQSIENSVLAGTTDLYEASKPKLVVVAQPAEVDNLVGLITDDAQQKLLALDFSRYFALAAFQGLSPNAGFSIHINRISRTGNIVSVYARLDMPEKDEGKAEEVTSPYHLVIVQKDGNWGEAITFALIANHALYFSVSHHIP